MTAKVYLITGAGHIPGIGGNTAKLALENGHKVIVSSRRIGKEWTELSAQYADITFVQGDIRDAMIQTQLLTVATKYGRLDTLVHNAAMRNSSQTPTHQDWIDELQMNVVIPYELTMLLRDLLSASNGSVVMIGSRSGLMATKANAIGYSTTKSAMHHLTKELALRLSPMIRVNCIAPGLTMSGRLMAKFDDSPELKDNIETGFYNNSLLNRTVNVDDIASMVLTVANNKSITGQIISVDCGATI
jgi:3-oxoacyl-[acyl-carrier protein] reductase